MRRFIAPLYRLAPGGFPQAPGPVPPCRRHAVWAALTVLFGACAAPPSMAPPAEAVAVWDGGYLLFLDLESAAAHARTPVCREARRGGGGGSLEDLIPCYREVAKGLALERLVLSELSGSSAPPDLEPALELAKEELGEGYDELRYEIYLSGYLRRIGAEIEVTDAEVEAHFAENREDYRRPGRLTLWNLFRRHQDAAAPEDTLELLHQLKERYYAGETFSELARQYSHSETRLRGGQVGHLAEGRLPRRLEKVAFALAPGDVSEPVLVRGGAVLLHVTEVVEAAAPTLQEAAGQIRRQLRRQQIETAIAQEVAHREPPPGSVVLTPEELATALDSGIDTTTVLHIAGGPLTVDDLRRLAGLGAAAQSPQLTPEGQERLLQAYEERKTRELLVRGLYTSDEAEVRQAADEELRRAALAVVVDQRVRAEMEERVDADPAALRRYFEDNRPHYQSPLRFKLQLWSLPFDADPPRQLLRMEELHSRIVAQEMDLTSAAAELGGTVEELGWREFVELRRLLPDKARSFLLQLGDTGYSVPYQQDEALHLVWLEERQEPHPMEYEEARDQVRDDYLARFEEDLYQEVATARLEAAAFVFREDDVRRLLTWPGETEGDTSAEAQSAAESSAAAAP